jgi:predicted nuclease with TOPRIM domain
MSEETTERLNGGDSFETRVLTALAAINGRLDSMDSRLTAIDARLTVLEEKVSSIDARLTVVEQKVDALEEKVDARLREARPIWEAVLERLNMIDAKFDAFAHDMYEMRAEINLIKKRVPPAA